MLSQKSQLRPTASPPVARDSVPSHPGLWQIVPRFWQRWVFRAPADGDTAIRVGPLLAVLFVPAVLLYGTLGHPLFEPDEGRYAQIPFEMTLQDQWIVPTMQGQPYLDKPPLFYWLVRLSYECFGVSIVAARLVPALAVHGTILLVYWLGRRSVGARAAFYAAMLLTITPAFLGIGRIILLDGLLTFFVTGSLLAGYEAVRTGRLRWGWWVVAALGSGLGFLTKGPIAELLLFPPLLAYAWLTGQRVRIGWAGLGLFAGIVVAVNLPWLIGMYREQPAFLKHFFWEHNVLRFLQPFDHLQPVWFYVPILLVGFVPGWMVGLGTLRGLLFGVGPARSLAAGFWWLAGLWTLAFFSISGSKLPTYILPAFPPLALALGESLARSPWWTPRRRAAGFLAGYALLAGIVYGFVPWYAHERSAVSQGPKLEPYIQAEAATIATFPRPLNSVAFQERRMDLVMVTNDSLNAFFVDCHFRPRTVILFTTANALANFKQRLPASLRILREDSFRHEGRSGLTEFLAGNGPWGLCDAVLLEPVALQSR